MEPCLRPTIKSKLFTNNSHDIQTVCFSPNHRYLVSAGYSYIGLINLESCKVEKEFMVPESYIYGSDFSYDGRLFVTANDDKIVRIWNVNCEDGTCTKLEGHESSVNTVKFMKNDCTKVVSGCDDKTIKVWDIERTKEIISFCSLGTVESVEVHPYNQLIFSGDREGDIRYWDIRSGNGRAIKGLDCAGEGVIWDVKFHERTALLASGTSCQKIKLFDFRTSKLLKCFESHRSSVRSISFHRSGKYLISGSYDKTIGIFEMEGKKRISFEEEGEEEVHHRGCVNTVHCSPKNGTYFASGGDDGFTFIWNFPLGKITRCHDEDDDEKERVKYLIDKDIFGDDDPNDFRRVFKIRILGDEQPSLCGFKILKEQFL